MVVVQCNACVTGMERWLNGRKGRHEDLRVVVSALKSIASEELRRGWRRGDWWGREAGM